MCQRFFQINYKPENKRASWNFKVAKSIEFFFSILFSFSIEDPRLIRSYFFMNNWNINNLIQLIIIIQFEILEIKRNCILLIYRIHSQIKKKKKNVVWLTKRIKIKIFLIKKIVNFILISLILSIVSHTKKNAEC